jgi:formyltetrahydrofolate deformylase
VEIPLIISNHMDLKPIADQFNIPFFHVPFTKDNKESGESNKLNYLKVRSTLLFWPVTCKIQI